MKRRQTENSSGCWPPIPIFPLPTELCPRHTAPGNAVSGPEKRLQAEAFAHCCGDLSLTICPARVPFPSYSYRTPWHQLHLHLGRDKVDPAAWSRSPLPADKRDYTHLEGMSCWKHCQGFSTFGFLFVSSAGPVLNCLADLPKEWSLPTKNIQCFWMWSVCWV